MTIVKDVDLAAFRKAGDKAYEVLKISDAKAAVHKEIGKNVSASRCERRVATATMRRAMR